MISRAWGWLMREWNFVDRGYDVIKFPATFIQFISIVMLAWFPETVMPILFLSIMGVVIVLVCSIAGHIDFGEHGTFPQRAILNRKASPYDRDTALALHYLLEMEGTECPGRSALLGKMLYWSTPLGDKTK